MAQPVQNQTGRYSLSVCVKCLLIFLFSSGIFHLANAHGQDDEHYEKGDSPEAPSLKYNREVNVEAQKAEEDEIHTKNFQEIQTLQLIQHGDNEPEGRSRNTNDNNNENYGLSNDPRLCDTNDKDSSCDKTVWQGDRHHHDNAKENSKQLFPSRLLFEALGAATLIRTFPRLILLFIPVENADQHKNLLKILLSFASGGLLGDAFLHIIPHALSPHSRRNGVLILKHNHTHMHSHGNSQESNRFYMGVGLGILSGILVFLMVEKFVRFVKIEHSNSQSHVTPKNIHTVVENSSPKKKKRRARRRDIKKEEKAGYKWANGTNSNGKMFVNKSEIDDKRRDKSGEERASSDVTTENRTVTSDLDSHFKVTGYLNLAADLTHNFIDGVAVGASFVSGENLGIVTSLAVFLHELPHDIRDCAILFQSGYSKGKAVLLQLTSALGAILGTLCTLYVEGSGDATTTWILPFTAGGFIYIASVSAIPELLKDSRTWQSLKEILAMLTGVCMMMLIALYE